MLVAGIAIFWLSVGLLAWQLRRWQAVAEKLKRANRVWASLDAGNTQVIAELQSRLAKTQDERDRAEQSALDWVELATRLDASLYALACQTYGKEAVDRHLARSGQN